MTLRRASRLPACLPIYFHRLTCTRRRFTPCNWCSSASSSVIAAAVDVRSRVCRPTRSPRPPLGLLARQSTPARQRERTLRQAASPHPRNTSSTSRPDAIPFDYKHIKLRSPPPLHLNSQHTLTTIIITTVIMAEAASTPLTQYVGFDSITRQIESKLLKRGFQFNVCTGNDSRQTNGSRGETLLFSPQN